MILDDGICTVYERKNIAVPGNMPAYEEIERFQSWYRELSFETSAAYPTEYRKERQTDARIRIMQCRDIRENDVAELSKMGNQDGAKRFFVTRAYHGTDDESGQEITDLTLAEVMA